MSQAQLMNKHFSKRSKNTSKTTSLHPSVPQKLVFCGIVFLWISTFWMKNFLFCCREAHNLKFTSQLCSLLEQTCVSLWTKIQSSFQKLFLLIWAGLPGEWSSTGPKESAQCPLALSLLLASVAFFIFWVTLWDIYLIYLQVHRPVSCQAVNINSKMHQGLLCWVMEASHFFSVRHSDVIAYFVRTDNENFKPTSNRYKLCKLLTD